LRNALSALPAARNRSNGIGLKATFLPDHAGEKLKRQAVRPCRRFDHQAHRFAGVGLAAIVRGLLRDPGDREFFDTRLRNLAICRSRGCILGDSPRHRRQQHHDRNAKRGLQTDTCSHCGSGFRKYHA
jgi:hypothetical protein